MSCESCKGCNDENDVAEDMATVPYIAYKLEMDSHNRDREDYAKSKRFHRWFDVFLIIIILVSNGIWMLYESQFEEVTTTKNQRVVQDAETGNNSFVGGDVNGTADHNDHDKNH